MTKVTIPNWVPLAQLKYIFNLLASIGESRLVGGCVRDIISGKVSADLDIATTVLPQDICKVLEAHHIKAIPTGIKHGTITAILDQYTLEITTLRKDIECFGRHATVEFTDSWEEDASRRDFTINAMSMDLEGNIYDYFGGQKDLHNKLVRFVGDPDKRVQEDYLRILRYFRFYSYFGGDNIDQKSLLAATRHASQISTLSGERIRQEILKILTSTYALDAIKSMIEKKIWLHLDCDFPNLDKLIHYRFFDDPIINLAAILRSTDNPLLNLNKIRLRWRLSNKETANLEMLCSDQYSFDIADDISIKRALYFLGKNNFLSRVKLISIEQPDNDLSKVEEIGENFAIPAFPLSGKHVKRIGFENKEIGEMILYATNAWINSDFRLKKEELIELIKSYYISKV